MALRHRGSFTQYLLSARLSVRVPNTVQWRVAALLRAAMEIEFIT